MIENYVKINRSNVATYLWCFNSRRWTKIQQVKKGGSNTKVQFTSPPYYRDGQKNEKFEQRAQNFEPSIHYIVEQEVATQGIRMSRGVELVLETR